MKKKSIFLIILIILFGIKINIAKAEVNCDSLRLQANRSLNHFSYPTNIQMSYRNRSAVHDYYLAYLFYNQNRTGYVFGYCQNPNLSTGRSDNNSYFRCERMLFDQNSSDEKQKMMEAGIVYLLRTYPTDYSNCQYNNNRGCYEYVINSLTLRIYDMLFPELNDNSYSGGNVEKLYVHESLANEYIKDNEIRELVKQIKGSYPTEFTSSSVNTYSLNGFYSNSSNITNSIKSTVKSRLINALTAGINYKEMVKKNINVELIPDYNGNNYIESKTEDDGTYLTKTIEFTFEVSNYSTNPNAYLRPEFTCAKCASGVGGSIYSRNVSLTFYINDEEMNSLPANIIKYISDNKVRIKIKFKVLKSNYNCDDTIDFNLSLNYYSPDSNNLGNVYVMFSENRVRSGNYQRFYVFLNDATGTTGKVDKVFSIDESVSLCENTCDYYLDLCEKGNNSACEKAMSIKKCTKCSNLLEMCNKGLKSACTKYDEECKNCNVKIINDSCHSTNSEIDIKEGYDVDYAKCEYSDSPQILSCIVENSDLNGNSYKSQVLNNNYCSVYCKEDYHLSMPGNISVESGRYFSLKAGISGTKFCYTSEINKSVFDIDLEKARRAVIDAYNTWSNYYNGLNNHGSNLTPNAKDGAVHEPHCTATTCTKTLKEGETCPTDMVKCTSKCNGNKASSYYGYSYSWKYDYYSYSGTHSIANGSYSSPGSSVCTHDSCKSTNGTDIGTTYNATSLASKATALKAAINNYISVVNNYNSCSGKNTIKYDSSYKASTANGWLMEYNYDPTIKFWYEESYMNNVIKDTLDTVGSINKTEASQKVCAGEVSENYETCTKNWTDTLTSSNKSQFVCKSSSTGFTCGNETITISNASYVKQEISASSSYITPTQFYTIYPTGAIVVADEGTNIENGSVLPNGLPVGFSAGRSIKSYALTIDNLGEYYDTNKLGRIWSNGKNVLAETLKNSSTCQSGALNYEEKIGSATFKNGVYVCQYIIDCPDCPTGYKCVKTKDGYYGRNGTIVSESVYNTECCPTCPTGYKCVRTKSGYYGLYGTIVTESEFKNQCCLEGKCPNSLNIIYRAITTENINPNNRELSANWKFDEKNIKTGLELKAYATTTEIQNNGNSIYDVNFDLTTNKDFAIEITMDAKMISKLRDINDKLESKGGYLTNTLKCYDYTSANGHTYTNMFCYSTIIDELLSDNNYKNNIKISVERPLTETARKNYKDSSYYWTTWYEAVSKNSWTTKTTYALDIGPAWK